MVRCRAPCLAELTPAAQTETVTDPIQLLRQRVKALPTPPISHTDSNGNADPLQSWTGLSARPRPQHGARHYCAVPQY